MFHLEPDSSWSVRTHCRATINNSTDTSPSLQVATGKRAPLPVWATREEMSSRTGGQLSMFEHRTLTQLLTTLWEHPHGGLVQQDITMFTRGAGKERKEEKKSTVDQFGRARALGRRKESQAKASVVPGEGVITVNGLSLSEYFRRTIDR